MSTGPTTGEWFDRHGNPWAGARWIVDPDADFIPDTPDEVSPAVNAAAWALYAGDGRTVGYAQAKHGRLRIALVTPDELARATALVDRVLELTPPGEARAAFDTPSHELARLRRNGYDFGRAMRTESERMAALVQGISEGFNT